MTRPENEVKTLRQATGAAGRAAIGIPTVGDMMVRTLKASGVRRVYGLPGDAINGFTDALGRDKDIAWAHVRHEEAAPSPRQGRPGSRGNWRSAQRVVAPATSTSSTVSLMPTAAGFRCSPSQGRYRARRSEEAISRRPTRTNSFGSAASTPSS